MSTRKHWRGPRRWRRPSWRSAGHLRPSGWGRRWISHGSPPRTPRARRMPNRKGDLDVRPIQAIRVDPVRTSRGGLHRHRHLPRRRRLDPHFLRRRGARRTGLQLRAGRSGRLQERSGRPHADACEGAGPRERRSRLGGPRGDAEGHATSGCPMDLFYHDLHTALIQKKGATAADFNRAVYERLKPGGCYVIVDHAAAAGAGTGDAQSLHRIDPASVREEVVAAGFVLDAESTILANKDDQHSIKVFDPSIKGETDRFAYRFVKR